MGLSQRKQTLKNRVNKSLAGNKANLEGIIIYVNSDLSWCNVKISSDVTLYQIPFADGLSRRLKRLQQSVLVTECIGNRSKYVVSGASRRKITVTDFASKGEFYWYPGGGFEEADWDDFHVWSA